MILLTGSSGFLGQTILNKLGKDGIKTLNRNAADYPVHLNSEIPVFNEPFKLVIHSAGKAHSVPQTEVEKQDFLNVNVNGTLNLLKGLENSILPEYFVFISSVSVYGLETGNNINEDAPLLAKDAYGDSKIQAELLIHNWCVSNNVICTILRLPLVAGSNPPGNLGAMIKGIRKGYYFNIAGGKARKSVVLAKDVAAIIPVAAKIGGVYNLTDGYHPSFKELSAVIAKQLNKKQPLNIPDYMAKMIALTGDILGDKAPLNSNKLRKITSDLTFDDSRARNLLRWEPTKVLEGFKID